MSSAGLAAVTTRPVTLAGVSHAARASASHAAGNALATWFAPSYALSVAAGQYACRARRPRHLLAEITAVLGIGPDKTAIRGGRRAACRRYHTSREKARTASAA
jgi:hypothetical protein